MSTPTFTSQRQVPGQCSSSLHPAFCNPAGPSLSGPSLPAEGGTKGGVQPRSLVSALGLPQGRAAAAGRGVEKLLSGPGLIKKGRRASQSSLSCRGWGAREAGWRLPSCPFCPLKQMLAVTPSLCAAPVLGVPLGHPTPLPSKVAEAPKPGEGPSPLHLVVNIVQCCVLPWGSVQPAQC